MSRIIKTKGIILNTRNFKESSLFASVLTPDQGRIQILARGCRRPRSKLCGTMERLNFNEIIYYKREEKDTYNLSDAVIIDDFAGLRIDPQRINAGLVIGEFFEKTQAPGQADEQAFNLMIKFLKNLSGIDSGKIRLYVYINLLRAIAIAGIKPHLDNCVRCRAIIAFDRPKIDFSTLAGGLVCERDYDETVLSLRRATVELMIALFQRRRISAGSEACEDLRILIPEYLYHHFDRLTLHAFKYI